MGHQPCFICEADLYISDPQIFNAELNQSCYYGKMVKGHSDDWVFDTDDNGRIVRVGKSGDDVYNMVGVSYFTKEDSKIISDAILKAYEKEGHEQLYWDEIVDQQIKNINMVIQPVKSNQIVEIDTLNELKEVDPNFEKYNEVKACNLLF